jgi:hypothetical protein
VFCGSPPPAEFPVEYIHISSLESSLYLCVCATDPSGNKEAYVFQRRGRTRLNPEGDPQQQVTRSKRSKGTMHFTKPGSDEDGDL